MSSACSEEGCLGEDDNLELVDEVEEMVEMELLRRDRVGAMKSRR